MDQKKILIFELKSNTGCADRFSVPDFGSNADLD
jgi:hypothetical protein